MTPARSSGGRVIGVTGTPGTGKKSVAPLLAEALGVRSLSLNDLAAESGAGSMTSHGLTVDTAALRRYLLPRTRDPCVVYGHLLPDVLRGDDVKLVFVLRCEPLELRRRLTERGYGRRKVRENVEAELIGVTAASALEAFGERSVTELETTHTSPEAAASELARMVKGARRSAARLDWIPLYASAEKLESLLSVERTGSART
ncbi:MAG TPA: AAA family ATPase [Nitrososphaerales archaeon]|nr:AAA family ATPase [Nitrososphaerales archaeon]HUK75184.1 AAA family ATPase [Nitrososphaerales archaeon]